MDWLHRPRCGPARGFAGWRYFIKHRYVVTSEDSKGRRAWRNYKRLRSPVVNATLGTIRKGSCETTGRRFIANTAQNKTAPIFNRVNTRRHLKVRATQDMVVRGEADPGAAVKRVVPAPALKRRRLERTSGTSMAWQQRYHKIGICVRVIQNHCVSNLRISRQGTVPRYAR